MCFLTLPEATDHLSKDDCIGALRVAMSKQRALAENMGFEISVRFLSILEELAAQPDVRLTYKTMLDDELRTVPARAVTGIFSALLLKYQERCDWTPLHDAKAALAVEKALVAEAFLALEYIVDCDGEIHTNQALMKQLADLVAKLRRPGAPRPDPSGS